MVGAWFARPNVMPGGDTNVGVVEAGYTQLVGEQKHQ